MRNAIILSGSSHPALTASICDRLGVRQGVARLSHFKNGETNVEIAESVRDHDVYILQSFGCPRQGFGHRVNDMFVELLIMINACRIASARRIIAVVPCFPYARQPEKVYSKKGKLHSRILFSNEQKRELEQLYSASHRYKQWLARSGTLVANMLEAAGADHIITMDLHDPQYQGFFNIPVDNLFGQPLMVKWIKDNIPTWKDAVVVSPDAGGAKRATAVADCMGLHFALIHTEKKSGDDSDSDSEDSGKELQQQLVGNVDAKHCIIIDDIADTSNTLREAAAILKAHGAKTIYAIVTHGILSGDARTKIESSCIDHLIASNTVPVDAAGKVGVFDVAPMLAEAIRRIHNGESVSLLFDGVPL